MSSVEGRMFGWCGGGGCVERRMGRAAFLHGYPLGCKEVWCMGVGSGVDPGPWCLLVMASYMFWPHTLSILFLPTCASTLVWEFSFWHVCSTCRWA